MLKNKLLIFSILILIFSGLELFAQADENPEELHQDSSIVKMAKMTKSPSGAIWRSLAVPGWGQIYVESYWKAPIFFAGSATLVFFIVDNHNKYSKYSDQLSSMKSSDADYEITKLRRDFFLDNRDMSAFYLLGVYILAAVDAYVGAHLYDFEVEDKLSLNLGMTPNYFPTVMIQIKF
jgi:hypothetical protein